MDTIGWVIIGILLAGIVITFIILNRKKEPKPKEIPDRKYETEAIWSDKEENQCADANQHRIDHGLKPLFVNMQLKILAQNRTLLWDLLGFNKESNLHENFLLDRKYLMDAKFSLVGEATCFNCKNPVGAFKNKINHNRLMLGDWDVIALDIRKGKNGGIYNCLVVGKLKE